MRTDFLNDTPFLSPYKGLNSFDFGEYDALILLSPYRGLNIKKRGKKMKDLTFIPV